MIEFKASKLRVVVERMKHCTTALGGAMSIVDINKSTVNTTKFKRVPIPSIVVRHFAKNNRVIKYIEPVLVAVTYYGDRVVALERHPLGNRAEEYTENRHGDLVQWRSLSHQTVEYITNTTCVVGQWYIDGYYVYRFDNTNPPTVLTSDNKFRSHMTKAYRLSSLAGITTKGDPVPQLNTNLETRYCISFTPTDHNPTFSPPIWKNVSSIGSGKLGDDSTDDDETVGLSFLDGFESQIADHIFDNVDEKLIVNVSFVIHAARKLASTFGFKTIEPLAIDRLMVSLHTVNVPNVKKAVKNTYDSGLLFTHMFAWVLGLSKQVNTLDSLLTIRSVLKHLTGRGIYHSAVTSNIGSYDLEAIPLLTFDEAVEIGEAHDYATDGYNDKDGYDEFDRLVVDPFMMT